MKRTPGEEPFRDCGLDNGEDLFARCEATTSDGVRMWVLFVDSPLGGRSGRPSLSSSGWARFRPVTRSQMFRTVRERHSTVRVTRAGRECHERIVVPTSKRIRREVMIRNGGSVKAIQMGEMNKILINRFVRAYRVVASVAEVFVERNVVRVKKGDVRISRRVVNEETVSTISSSDGWVSSACS